MIVMNRLLPIGKKFAALNLFGILFVKKGVMVDPRLINHERIHTCQGRELLWLPFYIVYLIEWIFRLVECKGDMLRAYRNISFEREAYDNESNLEYIATRRHYAMWRKKS